MFQKVHCDLCGQRDTLILMVHCPQCETLQCTDCMCECRKQLIEQEQTENNDSD
jgi:hypothetical protein